MNDKVLRKLRMEVELLIFVATMSIVLSAFMILDVSVVFTGFWQHGALISLLRICEFVLAIGWLLLSTKFSFDVQRLRKRHFRLVWYGFQIGFAPKLEEKQKEGDVAEIVRDMVAFYRTYYREVKVILALAIIASFSIIAVATYSVLYENLPFWDVFYRWLINVFLLLGATALYIYIHRSWGAKLSKVKDAEKRLSEMLGGPIEA
jgi:hypothetical protein